MNYGKYFIGHLTALRPTLRESPIHQMLLTQLQEAPQESHSNIGDFETSLLILSEMPQTTEQILAMGGVDNEILP